MFLYRYLYGTVLVEMGHALSKLKLVIITNSTHISGMVCQVLVSVLECLSQEQEGNYKWQQYFFYTSEEIPTFKDQFIKKLLALSILDIFLHIVPCIVL